MLINARTPEEARIAVVDGTTLEDYKIEVAERGLTRGNIYRGRIDGVEPSLNAAFIDYGTERNGFLPVQDVVPQAFYHQPKNTRRPRIDEVLETGRSIIVQVAREAEGSKGAVLTTDLSLAGRYLVLTPFDDHIGVSRKVEDEDTRKRLKEQVRTLQTPPGCGFIVRTNAIEQNKTVLNRDLNALLRLWKRIGQDARSGKGASLIHSDQDLILRALRDYLDNTIEEILIDDDQAFAKAKEYIRTFLPRGKTKLVRYSERAPLFSRFELEPQIERIFERKVDLPSGGSIVIDRTEALTAIDVNSGRSTKKGSQEETALHTNVEAAHELARQLRLRDIGGIVVVDFIDMRSRRNQSKLVTTLKEALKPDKARHTVGRISPNGLIEINRQKIEQALHMRTHRDCPTCKGTGRIGSPEMIGLNLLRLIESQAVTRPIERVTVELHPEVANAFQNDRRSEIAALEQEFDLRVDVNASSRLHRSEKEVQWVERKTAAKKAASPRRRVADRVRDLVAPKKEAAPKKAKAAKEPDKGADEKKTPSRTGRRRKRGRKSSKGKPADAQQTAAKTEQTEKKKPAAKPKPEDSAKKEESREGKPSRSRSRRRRSPRRRPRPKAESTPTTTGS
jgi:ribonuclease E